MGTAREHHAFRGCRKSYHRAFAPRNFGGFTLLETLLVIVAAAILIGITLLAIGSQ